MNYLEILFVYFTGTLVGIWLFKQYVQESIIVKTIDSLVENDFCRSYVNESGEVELYKWYELDDVIEAIAKEKEEDDEEDDC